MHNHRIHAAGSYSLRGDTVGKLFDDTVARFADREAIVVPHQNVRWTYRELRRRVDHLGVSLLELGFLPGDRMRFRSP
jgi:fatty-acyl-CoA synthase